MQIRLFKDGTGIPNVAFAGTMPILAWQL